MTTFVTTRAEPDNSDRAPPVWRAPEGLEGPGCGARGRRRGLAGQRADAPSHTPAHQAPPVRRAPEGPEGTGELQNAGPGRSAGGRWQGQGGPRDRPLRAAGSRVAISRAGRRPPAHTAARPIKASHAAPGTPVGPRAIPAGGPAGRPPTGASSSPAQHGTQREAARPHRDQAAHASGDSCQKPRISRRSTSRRRDRPRR